MLGKILSDQDMMLAAAELRRGGKRLVFTNGCFELLHVGHIRYLQAARALGDALVVGLNSDISVRTIKGAPRPLVGEAERSEVLAALSCVDYVVVFSEPTAERLVAAVRPDIYVKGGDYAAVGTGGQAPRPPEGAAPLKIAPEMRVVQQYGGQIVVLPYSSGHSTTFLIENILQSYRRPQ